ncbi:MAG: MaoC/PaaZ C-terminal domain-containing protein [Dehalococcoidia bacterium]
MTTQMAPKQVYWGDVQEGQEIPVLHKRPTPQQLVQFAAGSGDFNPIHYDQDHARSTGLNGIIVHGALKHGFLGEMLHEWVRPHGRVKRFTVSYRGMDIPGKEIRCHGRITRKYEANGEGLIDLEIWTENEEGQKTTPGTATVVLQKR